MAWRNSVASTSATLFTCAEEEDDDDSEDIEQKHSHGRSSSEDKRQQRRAGNISAASSLTSSPLQTSKAAQAAYGAGLKGSKRRDAVSRYAHGYDKEEDTLDETLLDLDDETGEGNVDGQSQLEDDLHTLALYNDTDDPLDRLIHISSTLLRTSKAILASSKRVNVVNGAMAQSIYNQEHEMQRHLEALEQGDRFMALMSRDAHFILHPTSEEPSISSLSPSRPALHPRLRSKLSDGAASMPSRARTMYVHASSGSVHIPSSSQSTNPHDISAHVDSVTAEEAELIQEISLASAAQESPFMLRSPPPSNNNAPPSPAISIASSSTPSTFLSSLFSRKSYLSSTASSSSPSSTGKEGAAKSEAVLKKDAKSLLTALAATKPATPPPTDGTTKTSMTKQISTASFASTGMSVAESDGSGHSPSPAPLPSASIPKSGFALPVHNRKGSLPSGVNAQLSAIMADPAHMTISSRRSGPNNNIRRGHSRSTASLSENLLRASALSSSTSAALEKESPAAAYFTRSAAASRAAPKVQVSNVPISSSSIAREGGRSRELLAPV